MYKETLNDVGKDGKRPLVFIIFLIVLLISVVAVTNIIYNRTGNPIATYATFICYGIIGIYVYRRKITNYSYTLIDDEIIFKQLSGQRDRVVITLKLKNIVHFLPISKEKPYKGIIDGNYFFVYNRKSKDCYSIIAEHESKKIRVVFKPSKTLIAMLNKAISK